MMTTIPPDDKDDDEIPEDVPKAYRNLFKNKEEANLNYSVPTEFKQKLEDVGTRYKHLTELHDLWSIGYDVLKGINASYETETDRQRITDLQSGIRLLEKQMEALSGYQDSIYQLAGVVNRLPKSDSIGGGCTACYCEEKGFKRNCPCRCH